MKTVEQLANIYVGKDPNFIWDSEEIYYNQKDYDRYLAFIAGFKANINNT